MDLPFALSENCETFELAQLTTNSISFNIAQITPYEAKDNSMP